jgi:hypothetical protein
MSKRISILVMLISLSLGLSSIANEGGRTGLELLECARENWMGETFHGTILLQLFRPQYSREYRMEVWSDEGGERALIRILEPAEEQGSGYLLLEDTLWYYTPQAGQAISLPQSALSQSFLGSDLALEDVSRGTLSEDYEVELLGTRPAEGGERIHRLRLTPKPEAPVAYGKLELEIRDSDCAVLLVDYYDQRLSLIREAAFSEFIRVEGEKPRVIPLNVVVDDLLAEGSRTVEVIETYEFGISIPLQRFTLECLVEGEEACSSS